MICGFFTENPLNYQIILFLNSNIWLIIVMSIIFLFGVLIFPFNLPAPLFNVSASVLLKTFLFRIFALIDMLLEEHIFQIFERIAFLVGCVYWLLSQEINEIKNIF
jgi:hypothetical protein